MSGVTNGKRSDRDHRGDELEGDICDGQPLGGAGGADRRYRGTGRGAYVLSNDERQRLIEADRAGIERGQRDCDRGGRGLHDGRHQGADRSQQQHTGEAREGDDAGFVHDRREVRGVQLLGEPAHALLQRRQPDQDQREAGDGAARRRQASASDHLEQRADEDDRQRGGGERDSDSERRHQPAGPGRADVGAEHEAQALREGQEPGADQPDRGHRGRARRLHQERDDRAPEGAEQRRRRRLFHHLLQGRAGERLEPVGHYRHAQQEQADAADDRDDRFQLSSRPLCDSTVGKAIGSAGGWVCRQDDIARDSDLSEKSARASSTLAVLVSSRCAAVRTVPRARTGCAGANGEFAAPPAARRQACSHRQARDVADRHVERELERPARTHGLRQQ